MKKISFSNKIFRMAGLTLVAAFLLGAFVAPTVSAATAKDAVCEGAGLVTGSGCAAPEGSPDADTLVARGLNLFSAIVGIIAVVMIIMGGLKYMTSQGDSGQLTGAKNTLIYAAVGLVVVALAQVVVQFVLKRFTTIGEPEPGAGIEIILAFMV